MDEKSKELNFYPSKIKKVFMIIFGLLFLVAAIAICHDAFLRKDYFMVFLGGIMIVLLLFFIPYNFIRIIKPVPTLTLTDEELILNPGHKKSYSIKWEDIESFRMISFYYKFMESKFIEIYLFDDEKYKAQLSGLQRKVSTVGTLGERNSLFSIFLNQIKKSEHERLFYALGNITTPDFDVDYVPESKYKKRIDSIMGQLNRFFKISYLFSFIMTAAMLMLFYKGLDEMLFIKYMIISFGLFPFARFIVDIMFIYNSKGFVERKSDIVSNLYQLVRAIIYFFLFWISPIIGSIGLLYFILIVIRRRIEKKKDI